MSKTRTAEEYLKEPYSIVLVPDTEVGGFTASITELPGCFAEGETADEAVANVREAAVDWIAAAQREGQEIPVAASNRPTYNGRVALRLPRSLHRKAVETAASEGTSLNQYLVAAVAEKIGGSNVYAAVRDVLKDMAGSVYKPLVRPSLSNFFAKHSLIDSCSAWESLYQPVTCEASIIGEWRLAAPPIEESVYFPHNSALTVIRVPATTLKAKETVTDVQAPAA